MLPQTYTPAHYPTVARWYQGHHAPTPEQDTLIDGIVLPDRGAIFFYDDPRSPALITYFIVTNPQFPTHAEETIAMLIIHAEETAKLRHKRMILAFSGKPALAARFADAGWEYVETTILTAKSWD